MRQVKGNKGQALQIEHKLLPLEKSLNYFKALLLKKTAELQVKENLSIKNVLDIKNLNKLFEVEEAKKGTGKLKQNKIPGIDS